MKNIKYIFAACVVCLQLFSCGKKNHPSVTTPKIVTTPVKKIKPPTPKVIVVNDSIARKTFDGRLYYDLDGKRYWRNNKDGKYYIYNKSMNTNEAFKVPRNQ